MASNNILHALGGSHNRLVYSLNHTVLREVRYHLRANATALSCHQIIERFLVRGVRLRGASKQLQKFVEAHLVPFFRSMVDNFVACGWCAYVLRRRKVRPDMGDESVLVPIVIPMEHARFELHADRSTHEFTMHCLQVDGTAKIRGARVVFLNEIANYANDLLMSSPLVGILGELRYVEQMKKFSVQAEFVRTHPPVYLEAARGTGSEGSTAAMAGGMASRPTGEGPPSITEALRARARGQTLQKPLTRAKILEKASTDMMSNVEFHAQQMDEFARGQNENYFSLGLNYAPPHQHSLFVCPPGMTLAARPDAPQARTDQVDLDEHLTSKVLAAFGIPETIFAGNSRSARPRAQDRAIFNVMHINMFDATLETYRLAMRDAFCRVYFEIFRSHLPSDRIIFEPPPLYARYLEHLACQFDSDDYKAEKERAEKRSKRRREESEAEEAGEGKRREEGEPAAEGKRREESAAKSKRKR